MSKQVLDPASGSRMFYYDKSDSRVLFGDIRNEHHELKDNGKIRQLHIEPDEIMDFTNLRFEDNSFSLVVFDPPHLKSIGATSWMARKYGKLDGNWKQLLRDGFTESFRVLKPNGTLIFKWNEYDIPTKDILLLTKEKPLFGHRSGKQQKTHWIVFIKEQSDSLQSK